MNLRDEGKKAVLHVKQSHLYLKNKKNICQSTSHASSHLNTILHTGEKFGVLVKKKKYGKYLKLSSLHYSANSWHRLSPIRHWFHKKEKQKNEKLTPEDKYWQLSNNHTSRIAKTHPLCYSTEVCHLCKLIFLCPDNEWICNTENIKICKVMTSAGVFYTEIICRFHTASPPY